MSKIIKNVKDKIIRVAIYIRVSTEEQAKHGYSIESQKSRLIEWAKEHNYQVVDIYAMKVNQHVLKYPIVKNYYDYSMM